MFSNTIKTNGEFIIKVLKAPSSRYTRVSASYAIEKRVEWVKTWEDYAGKYAIGRPFDWSQAGGLANMLTQILSGIVSDTKSKLVRDCNNGQYHPLYRELNHDVRILSHGLELEKVTWILKCRCELLHLNYIPWMRNRIYKCSLCNMNAVEDTEHFLAVCPILACYRKNFLGAVTLSRCELIDILNGKDWINLYRYVRAAWTYRRTLVNEFNYNLKKERKWLLD